MHLIAATGWACLFLYSAFILADRILHAGPYTIIHVIVSFALLLVSIRAWRRYLKARPGE